MEDNKRISVLEMIAADMENDAKNFDGQPFNGKTVADPELLMVCKAAKGLLEGLDRTEGNVYEDIKEAINKAEGKGI